MKPALAEWQPIETAPRDGTAHIRGLYVHQKRAEFGDYVYWDCYVGYIEPNHGAFISLSDDDLGWDADDFSHWMPLPEPPKDA